MRIPFRVAIITLVAGLLLATAGTLTLYGFREGFRDVQLLRRAYLEQTVEIARLEASRLPRLAERILKTQRSIAELGRLPTDEPMALARIFAASLAESPELTWLSYGEEPSGRFAGATRASADAIVVNVSDPAVGRGVPREFKVTAGGQLEPVVRTPPLTAAYDPRTRPWYRAAREKPGVVVWMPPYEFNNGGKGITAASLGALLKARGFKVERVSFADAR